MRRLIQSLQSVAPTLVAASLIAGNGGLLVRRGLHPDLGTLVGLLWIVSAYVLRLKPRYPVAAPRLNAAGVILGSLCLSASGMLAQPLDWHRIRTPLGYIPAAALIGMQKELRHRGRQWLASGNRTLRLGGQVLMRPFLLSAVANAYGVLELALSARAAHDTGLLAISLAYAVATVTLPLLDAARA